MQARLAAQKKKLEQDKLKQQGSQTSSNTVVTLSRDALQERIREELGNCPAKDIFIDHSALLQNELEQKPTANNVVSSLIDEEITRIRSLVKNQVLKIHTEQHFPDIDDMLHFEVLFIALTIPKIQQLREEGHENVEAKNLATSGAGISTTTNHYCINVQIPLAYPSQCPIITLQRVTTEDHENPLKMQQVENQLKQIQIPIHSMQDMMQMLTTIVRNMEEEYIRTETRSIAHQKHLEIQEMRKKEMESIGEERSVIMDYDTYVEEGSIISKSETGVIRRGKFISKPPKLDEEVCKQEIAVKTFLFKKDESELPQLRYEMKMLW
jgi:hypothetical protein